MTIELTFPPGGALVSGGAGRIGAGIARRLATAGVPVVFTYKNNEERARKVEDEFRAAGLQAVAQHMDMSSAESVDAAIQRVIDIAGRLHTVANSGGPSVIFKTMAEFTPEELSDFVDEDAGGIFRLVHQALPHLRAGGGGSITICTTMAFRRFIKFDGLSSFSKGAIEGLVRYIAAEEGPNKIRCNAVPIGWIADEDAAGFAKMAESVRATRPNLAELVDQIRGMVAEPGKPDEAGNLFAFLASNESRYITGQSIMIDGGATL